MKKDKFSAQSLGIGFEGGLPEVFTAHAGVSLLVEAVRRSGVMATADRVLPAKKNPKGLTQGQMVESLVVLSVLGGECLDDLQMLREDQGLEALLGYQLPAPSTARNWLEQFHDEKAVAQRPLQGSFIPQESPWLTGLREVNRRCVRGYLSAVETGRQVTLDVDAHLVECSKREALRTYLGFRGYQPLIVAWAETGLILADQFRDGNVPASEEIATLVDEAYEALPGRPDGWDVRIRSDSAAYEEQVLAHWGERGWKFAVSADMTQQLRQEIARLSPADWQIWEVEPGGFVREWAEVAFVPSVGPRSEI